MSGHATIAPEFKQFSLSLNSDLWAIFVFNF